MSSTPTDPLLTDQPSPRNKQTSYTIQTGITRRYRKRILETMAIVAFGVSVLYSIVFLLVFDNVLSSASDALFAALYIGCYALIKKHKLITASYALLAIAGVQITAGSVLFVGRDTGFGLYFLALPMLIYFLLWQQSSNAKLCVVLWGGLLFIIGHT
ncbi:MAG: hypothetical protein CUN55_17865, partial [Phototrophicales bacterium]